MTLTVTASSLVPDTHRAVLADALRAPSAHNAQPWRIVRTATNTYDIHYDHTEYLPHDPDDRDAYLTMGAFIETLALAAPNHGLTADIDPVVRRIGDDLQVATVTLRDRSNTDSVDSLSEFVGARSMNRNAYRDEPVDPALRTALLALGNVILDPAGVAPIVAEASRRSWADRQFVRDLDHWYRTDPRAADGYTARQMHMSGIDLPSFWVARKVGRVPSPLNRAFATRDVAMAKSCPAVAVLGANGRDPFDVFEAGRALLRSWVTLAAFGYSCHPISIAIDVKATAPKLATLAGLAHPMALYRIGRTDQAPRAGSNRKPLSAVLRSA